MFAFIALIPCSFGLSEQIKEANHLPSHLLLDPAGLESYITLLGFDLNFLDHIDVQLIPFIIILPIIN